MSRLTYFPGKCIGLRQCGNIISLLKRPIPNEVRGLSHSLTTSVEVILYLRKSVCGFSGRLPDVCCPGQIPVLLLLLLLLRLLLFLLLLLLLLLFLLLVTAAPFMRLLPLTYISPFLGVWDTGASYNSINNYHYNYNHYNHHHNNKHHNHHHSSSRCLKT